MRGWLRLTALVIVLLFLAGLLRQRPWESSSGRFPRPASLERDAAANDTAAPLPFVGPAVNAADDDATGYTSDSDSRAADTQTSPRYRSGFVRALGSVINQHGEVFGDAESGLQEELDRADAILSDARTSSRAALRQANRQVRLPGRSTHVIIFLISGLESADLPGLSPHAPSSPTLSRLLSDGLRTTYTPSRPSSTDGVLQELLSGRRVTTGDNSDALPRRLAFAQLFWGGGYSTGLLGDWSGTGYRPHRPGDWEQACGWTDGGSELRWKPCPDVVSLGRRAVRIPQDSGGAQTSFATILTDEVVSLAHRPQRRHPLLLFVATPFTWWQKLASTSTGEPFAGDISASERLPVDGAARQRASAIELLDRFLGETIHRLEMETGASRLAVVVLGMSTPADTTAAKGEDPGDTTGANPAGTSAEPRGLSPLVIRWPGKIPAGAISDVTVEAVDILPTLADLTQTTRRSGTGDGRSRATEWATSQAP